ncbi:MAG: amidophosphoribosyltransferase, partial [Chlamydiia bacterium]|nr:amidophosphoribosyltransferase [Chlamydiia bacterium]
MCGVIGVMDSDPVAEPIYQSLIQLQHRGQDAAGMFTYDPVSKESVLHKSRGLVSQVFNYKTLPLPEATWGIGHVRYQTVGTGALEDTQPLVIGQGPKLAVAYNGNIVNYHALRRELENEGHQFHTDADTEVLLLLLHKHIGEGAFSFENLCSAVREIYRRVVGAYSVAALLTGYGLFAFRDPSGIRPLLMGT